MDCGANEFKGKHNPRALCQIIKTFHKLHFTLTVVLIFNGNSCQLDISIAKRAKHKYGINLIICYLSNKNHE